MNSKFKKFLIKEGLAPNEPTVFIVSFGDGRPSYGGSSMEKLIGIFATHDEALEAGDQANVNAGITPDSPDHYGAMIDEVGVSEIVDTLRELGFLK